jgi:NAD(P)-dependent dehydrogenase (short-subunit alcohol dehydrogenase family)
MSELEQQTDSERRLKVLLAGAFPPALRTALEEKFDAQSQRLYRTHAHIARFEGDGVQGLLAEAHTPDFSAALDQLDAVLTTLSAPCDIAVLRFEDVGHGFLASLSEQEWQRSLRLNARASWLVAQRLIARCAKEGPSILVFSSRASDEAVPGIGAFGPFKTLEAMLMRSLAAENSGRALRINLLAPTPAEMAESEALAELAVLVSSSEARALSAASLTLGREKGLPVRQTFALPSLPKPAPAPQPAARRLRAIVTGGAGRIGSASALALHRLAIQEGREGLDVLLADRDEAHLLDVCRTLCDHGIRAVPMVADLSDATVASLLVEATLRAFGGLDVVFSNAALGVTNAVSDAPVDIWEKIVATNLGASWRLAVAAHPHLRQSGGSLVATSSIAALSAGVRAPLYAATKQALNMLVAQLAQEWSRDGVRVNSVSPGSIETPMNQLSALTEQERSRIVDTFPIPRLGQAEEIAAGVAFLVSGAASYITGHNLIIDGGLAQYIR